MTATPTTLPERRDVSAEYRERIQAHEIHVADMRKREFAVLPARGITFAVALGLLMIALASTAGTRTLLLSASGLVFALFVFVIRSHELLQTERKTTQVRLHLQRQRLGRYERNWRDVSYEPIEVPQTAEATSRDLDLFCRGGVWHWLNHAHTPMGRQLLRDWLITPAELEQLPQRQQSVARLAEEAELRYRAGIAWQATRRQPNRT